MGQEAASAAEAAQCKWVPHTLAAKPGDDLLFHRLSDSTIGADWFHGRVRDGIGWVTVAMVTKLWGRRVIGSDLEIDERLSLDPRSALQRSR